MTKNSIKRPITIFFLLALGAIGFFIVARQTKIITISKGIIRLTDLQVAGGAPSRVIKKGVFRGEECERADTRSVGVMIAGDVEARPLWGIGSADMVIEMPVTPDGITRSMAIFQCAKAQTIGSVRSARAPFLGIAKGYGLIFAHWGGERDSLDTLHKGLLDNIDALPNPFNAFYRKDGIPMPHDGFTSSDALYNAAKQLRYPVTGESSSFFSFKETDSAMPGVVQSIGIPYIGSFAIQYRYDHALKSYARFRGGSPEIDSLTNKQIYAKNVLILFAKTRPTYSQYVDVALEGERGKLLRFQNGERQEGFWEKKEFSEPLLFYGSDGLPLGLAPGASWVEVVEEGKEVSM